MPSRKVIGKRPNPDLSTSESLIVSGVGVVVCIVVWLQCTCIYPLTIT